MGRNSSAVFLPLKIRKRLNAPPANQPWGWFSFELLESAAMRSLSVNGRRVLDRIRLELPVAEPGDFRPPTNEWKSFSAAKATKARVPSGNGKDKAKLQAWARQP
jgi:hypothetical protein